MICAFLQPRNPKIMVGMESFDISTNLRIDLKAQGHDGVVGMHGDQVFEYVAFNPSQIGAWHKGILEIHLQPETAIKKPKHQKEESGLSL